MTTNEIKPIPEYSSVKWHEGAGKLPGIIDALTESQLKWCLLSIMGTLFGHPLIGPALHQKIATFRGRTEPKTKPFWYTHIELYRFLSSLSDEKEFTDGLFNKLVADYLQTYPEERKEEQVQE